MSSSSTVVLCLLFCLFLTGFFFYEGFVIQQKTVLDTDAVKSVYVYLKPIFVVLQISHKNRIQLKNTEEETKNVG